MTRNSCRVGRACAARSRPRCRSWCTYLLCLCGLSAPQSYSETLDFHFDAICGMVPVIAFGEQGCP